MNKSTSNQASVQLSDPELETLLGDAFDAPPVPRSLLKRIDRAVEQEWGTSPRLADTSAAKVTRSLGRGARWVKTLPIAAALSALLVVTLFFLPPGLAPYGWADMVEALREQGMVLIETPEEARWMAAEEGVVATTDGDSSELLDLKQGFRLNRPNGGLQIRRQLVSVGGNQRDKMVLALILGRAGNRPSHEFLENARIADESSKEVSVDGRQLVQLNVRVESVGFGPVSLRLVVDPTTHLPATCDVDGWKDVAETLAFSYPKRAAAELLALNFPADLAVVDVGPNEPIKLNVVLNEVRTASREKEPVAVQPVADEPVVAIIPDAVAPAPDTPVVAAVEPPEPPMSGSPSQWRPVVVQNRSSDQVVHEMNQLQASLWRREGRRACGPGERRRIAASRLSGSGRADPECA